MKTKRTRAFRWKLRKEDFFFNIVILWKDGGERLIRFDGQVENRSFRREADWFLVRNDAWEEVPEAELALII